MAATCRELSHEFVWRNIRTLDVRDEWKSSELAAVASLMQHLDILSSVEKIHCFPTVCVDKWLTICLRLGQQLRYLQFGHPSMAEVKSIVAKLDPHRVEYLFFAHVPPNELKAFVDRKCYNMRGLTVCGIVPNVPDQHMLDLFSSVSAHTGKLHELTLKLGNSPADLPQMFQSLQVACKANPQLQSVHIVHFTGGYNLLKILFGEALVKNSDQWYQLSKKCLEEITIPLRGLRLTGQTAWQAIMAELELQPAAQRVYPNLNDCKLLFEECYSEADFAGRADAIGEFLTALRQDSEKLPQDYEEWTEEVISHAHDRALLAPFIPAGVIRGEKALAAWSLRTGKEPQRHLDRFTVLLEATTEPLLSLVRSLSPQLLNTQLPVVTELLRNTKWCKVEWVKAVLTQITEDEQECMTRLLSSPDALAALLEHPGFDFALLRPNGQLCITWLLSIFQFSVNLPQMQKQILQLLQLHQRAIEQLHIRPSIHVLSTAILNLIIDNKEAADLFASVFFNYQILLQPATLHEFLLRSSLPRLKETVVKQYSMASGQRELPPQLETEIFQYIWRSILEQISTLNLFSTVQAMFSIFPNLAVPDFVVAAASISSEGSTSSNVVLFSQIPPQVREILRVALVSAGVAPQLFNAAQPGAEEPPAKRPRLEYM